MSTMQALDHILNKKPQHMLVLVQVLTKNAIHIQLIVFTLASKTADGAGTCRVAQGTHSAGEHTKAMIAIDHYGCIIAEY